MKKTFLILTAVLTIFFFGTCALEIANVIGPDGGYVFFDKGNYDGGWRYVQCSSYDHGEIRDEITIDIIKKANEQLIKESAKWYSFDWELPDEDDLRKMLNCFSYGLTRFSPDFYYLAVNNMYSSAIGDPPGTLTDDSTWEIIVLHKNFDVEANGKVEKVDYMTEFPESVRIRPIRRF